MVELLILTAIRCNLNFQVYVGNVEQSIALFAYRSNLRLSLHTFLFVLRDNKRFVTRRISGTSANLVIHLRVLLGQMYDHLILVAHEYLDNVETCPAEEEEQKLGKTEFGEQLYKIGGFPPIKIKLPDELNTPPSNSDSKESLMGRLDQVMQRLRLWEPKVDAINSNYKVKHEGFSWLNGREWYDLVNMQFNHHLRQKRELEQKLVF